MKVDFALITIRPDEYEAISDRFTPKPYKDPSSQHAYGISQIQIEGGKICTVAIARTSRAGNDTSQQIANRMIHDLDPQMLLVVGIGGGVPDNDFTLGDVIISSHIHNFDVNAVKGNQTTFDVTGGIHPLVSEIISNLYLYQSRFADWNSEASIMALRPSLLLTEKYLKDLIDTNVNEVWRDKVEQALMWHFDKNQRGARAPKYLSGTIASSNTLVRSDALLAQWLQNARSIRAVEMEAAGVYLATQQISKQYPIMAIRGISDIIGFKRNDNWTQYACHTAAAFAHAFIQAGIVDSRETEVVSPKSTLSLGKRQRLEDTQRLLEEELSTHADRLRALRAEWAIETSAAQRYKQEKTIIDVEKRVSELNTKLDELEEQLTASEARDQEHLPETGNQKISSETFTTAPPKENAHMSLSNDAAPDSQNPNSIKIFTLYADADKTHKERLETQLSPYTWNGMMDLWDKDRITASAELMQEEINKHIDSSQIILLLVSPHFPTSRVRLAEMTRAMQRRITHKTIIIPIFIRPIEWEDAPFAGLFALPRNGKPVNSWSNTDEAWYSVAVDIRKACDGLLPRSNP